MKKYANCLLNKYPVREGKFKRLFPFINQNKMRKNK